MLTLATAQDADIRALCTDLVEHHHAFIRQEGPVLLRKGEALLQNHSMLTPVYHILQDLLHELEPHMMKEEMILFPLCQRLELASEAVTSHCGSVRNPIRAMKADHSHCEKQLQTLALLTDEFTPMTTEDPAYKIWLKQLQAFCEDLDLHMAKENKVLFPRALAREGNLNQLSV